jgi:hypothetical protein
VINTAAPSNWPDDAQLACSRIAPIVHVAGHAADHDLMRVMAPGWSLAMNVFLSAD